MTPPAEDDWVLKRIQDLAGEKHRLYAQGHLGEADRARLKKIQAELDQCWDLLRQRRALRDAGQDPSAAYVRPPEVVEEYEQ